MATCSGLPEKVLKHWNSKGKEEALGLFQKAFKKVPDDALEGDLEFRRLLCDVVKHAVDGNLESEEVAAFFGELVSQLDMKEIFPSLLADILAIFDAEVVCNEGKEQRGALRALVSACRDLLGESLLKERLDMDTLEMVGLVQSKANFNQKYVKTKTKLFYKQQKFNLFREENEGYSKLMAELGHERRLDVAAPAMLENIKSLIGRFNLDPNRVLDVILEAFECHLDEGEFFLPLLRQYPCETTTFVNILGFKFQCYQNPELAKTPPTPSSLYELAAQLLHGGLVQLQDLYPHLSVSDRKLKEFHESVMEEAKTKAKKANVISLAEKTEEEKDREAEAQQEMKEYRKCILSRDSNQKLGVCHALLEMGDWQVASRLMALLPPFLPAWAPYITTSLCQMIHLLMEPLYRNYSPRAAKGVPLPSLPPDALENLQQCSRFSHLSSSHVMEMLLQLGPHVHTDPLLLAKVLRVGRAFLKEKGGSSSDGGMSQEERDVVYRGFISVLDEVVLPSLSLLQCNCGIAEETWSMMKQLPYETRYQLYGHWKNDTYEKHPELIEARTQILSRGRYIMKRLTKDNVKPSGRYIGKLSHSNPGIIFDYVLSQIQRYDNFIIPVVDSLKYLTPLAYDVLASVQCFESDKVIEICDGVIFKFLHRTITHCIIEALGNPQKERMKHEDTNISHWLQGLASFCANVFKKYPIELTGLLQYITNQLKAGKSFDLLVLKEVVQKMAGIDISVEVTSSQLEALAGGELLKAEGGYFSQVRNTKKSSQRLREALVDANLSVPLCLLMAQQRDCIIFREGANRHLKLVGTLYDNCLDTLVQFGGFLSTHLTSTEYSQRVPPLNELGQDYHIPADVAFFMLRPLIGSSISDKFSELEKASKAESDKQDKKSKAVRQENNYLLACQHVMESVVEAAKPLHPPKVWEDMSCKLYTTFWSLSLYDLYVPVSRYDEEVNKAKQAMQALEDDLSSSKKKKEQERSMALIEKLQEERQRQEDNHRLVMARLRQEKDTWFSARVTKNRTITQVLQLCVFPRCRFTASDAIFCAKFIYMLHSLQAPNFSTLLFFDRVFSDISYTVAFCTENEVRRYGRFLGALLEIVSKWHTSGSVYTQECARTPGFISMMRSSGSGNEKQYLDYENYRHITFKWHFKLTKSLVVLLESKDYMQVRNGLIVLTKVLPYYPKVYHLCIALEKRIEKIMEEEKEKRADLYTLAIGYAGMLKTHKPNLVPESEFHNREERVKAQQSESENKVSTSSKPQEREKEGSVEATKEEKQGKSTKTKPPSSEESTSKVSLKSKPNADESKSSSDPSNSQEQVSGSGGDASSKGAASSQKDKEKEKERGRESGKTDVKEKAKERANSEEKKEKKATVAAAAAAPKVGNGPVGRGGSSSPARGGQRRQHSGEAASPDTAAERETKRRKLEDDGKLKVEDSQMESDREQDKSSSEKDKTRKRDRSSDKETSESKRRKESPDTAAPAKEIEATKEKKRLVKVSKKENSKTGVDPSPTATMKGPQLPKRDTQEEKTKKHKVRTVKK